MKKVLLTVAGLLCTGALSVFACTNIIVGKKASADGSVICTYNCDTFGYSGWLTHSLAGQHAPGEKIAIRHFWKPGEVKGYVDQVPYTYNVVGYMNEHQLTILETTFGGREELQDPEGILGYDNLMQLALQRCRTAREAILEMGRLANEYGYCDSGETFSVCDPSEAWIMEIIGKGPGKTGAVWVALRVPDDAICAHANQSRIRKIPFKDKENCLYSKDVVSFAREKGYFSGKDADFSFREAYCPFDFTSMRLCEPRVWSVFRHHTDPAYMDSFLPYLNGQFEVCDELPLWIKPDKPVTLQEIMADMRDHFEGTPLDMTADVMAGPWSSPYRPRAKGFTSEGKKYFRERPISTQQAGFSVVAQLRSWLPDAVGGVYYFNCDDPSMIAYVPVYCGTTEIPPAFAAEHNRNGVFDEGGAFWLCNWVANMVYPRYSAMMGDLVAARNELEQAFAQDQAAVEAAVRELTPEEQVAFLNERTAAYTRQMMERWSRLARELIVKYNDQPGSYDQPFWDAVARDTGDRYLVPGQ
ncbi:MAG: C69 family dipeptidase [Bacteroidales bacterium]|nr:C69 family dipeptidase [Bacteroidales bacterium]